MKHYLIPVAAAALLALPASLYADDYYRPSATMWLTPEATSDIVVPFAPTDEGVKLPVRWGMDVAWLSEQNMRKGINHIGLANLSLVRSSFQTTEPLNDDGSLTAAQIEMLKKRNAVADLIGNSVDLVLNEDQEAGIVDYYVKNGKADADHWAKLIDASVAWIEANSKHKVIALSPFNEPDYGWGQGTLDDMKEIARKIKEEYPRLKDKAVTGGNTLNDDRASTWYNGLKPYVDWGNTHQLAGSFENYANFFAEVKKDGLHPYADELHNVGEAMIGAEYGMQTAVWWGFDSRARGEFCDISNNGSRIAYKELRDKWTAASVYRHNDGKVKAFIGSSERQANTSSYLFVNKERAVYFDGQGPTREWRMEIPGGTGYQTGQTNAERVVDITWGPDVPTKALRSFYAIVNKATGTLLSESGDAIDLTKQVNGNATDAQTWNIAPVDSRIGGDYSFYTITSDKDKRHIDVENYSCLPEASVIAYANDTPSSNQQWYLEYAGDGFYYLRNRESALYLTAKSKYAINHVGVNQNTLLAEGQRDRQLWRFIIPTAEYHTNAPAQPSGLTATANAASVTLQWTSNTEKDLSGYMILRAEKGKDDWNTIGRGVLISKFTDNTCLQGHTYIYKVVATDLSENRSKASDEVEATPTGAPSMIARWTFNRTVTDETVNMMDAVCFSPAYFAEGHKDNTKSLTFDGTSSWIQLPYEVASSDELTIAMWVKWTNSSKSWTRLFDFGTDTDHYMFLTPKADSDVMRLALKNGGSEQTLDCTSRLSAAKWTHVAVTLGKDKVAIYINGEEAASTASITIKPSEIGTILNYIGRSQFSSDPLFQGYISDLRIYNHALAADDVRKAMEGQASGIAQTVKSEDGNATAKTYNLSGQRASKGLLVSKGRKFYKK